MQAASVKPWCDAVRSALMQINRARVFSATPLVATKVQASAFERFQISQHVLELVGIRSELRHGWMAALIPSDSGRRSVSIGYLRCNVRNAGAIVSGLSLA